MSKYIKQHTLQLFLASLSAIILSACASGPRYSEAVRTGALNPKDGKGIALIYFGQGAVAGGTKTYHVYANKQLLTDAMRFGRFYSYEAIGPVSFSTNRGSGNVGADVALGTVLSGGIGAAIAYQQGHDKDQLTLQMEPQKTYYIEMRTAFWREKMELVSKEKAESKIQQCQWLNPTR